MGEMALESFIKQTVMAIKNEASNASGQATIEVEFDLCISCIDSKIQVIPTLDGDNPNASKIKFKLEVDLKSST